MGFLNQPIFNKTKLANNQQLQIRTQATQSSPETTAEKFPPNSKNVTVAGNYALVKR